jgi:hypothetical protein
MNENERNYYMQLHETARTYQTQIWAVPAVFFALQGVVIFALDFTAWLTLKNMIILLGNGVFSYLLSLVFIKTSSLELLIQARINVVDDKANKSLEDEGFRRIPLYSLRPDRFLHELKNASIDLKEYQREAIIAQVGNKFSFLMRSISYLSLVLALIMTSVFIYQAWLPL